MEINMTNMNVDLHQVNTDQLQILMESTEL